MEECVKYIWANLPLVEETKRQRFKEKYFHTCQRRLYNLCKKKKFGWERCTNPTELFGCDMETLASHIESQFSQQSSSFHQLCWAGYGDWHVDHITCVKNFPELGKKETQQRCFHYTNLRPLPGRLNHPPRASKIDNVPVFQLEHIPLLNRMMTIMNVTTWSEAMTNFIFETEINNCADYIRSCQLLPREPHYQMGTTTWNVRTIIKAFKTMNLPWNLEQWGKSKWWRLTWPINYDIDIHINL